MILQGKSHMPQSRKKASRKARDIIKIVNHNFYYGSRFTRDFMLLSHRRKLSHEAGACAILFAACPQQADASCPDLTHLDISFRRRKCQDAHVQTESRHDVLYAQVCPWHRVPNVSLPPAGPQGSRAAMSDVPHKAELCQKPVFQMSLQPA